VVLAIGSMAMGREIWREVDRERRAKKGRGQTWMRAAKTKKGKVYAKKDGRIGG